MEISFFGHRGEVYVLPYNCLQNHFLCCFEKNFVRNKNKANQKETLRTYLISNASINRKRITEKGKKLNEI